ncbi:hypothetical protein FZI02_08960 [Cronobacter sakazakii]|nr:hypothetical protein [Cronobacter sakazakii]EJG0747473.1 hypothetical protein [Cronobacter sakazakii]KAB0839046.1 hypothetical protein FZI45_18950 [Cronobacter sakazakii]KAB0840129.1 hypothetical protein FZI02_08960 [Cronobacter sakazakii]
MSNISNYPAVRQINFYVNEASPELISARRNYLQEFLLPTWETRLKQMLSWSDKNDSDLELIEIYRNGVEYLTQALKRESDGEAEKTKGGAA